MKPILATLFAAATLATAGVATAQTPPAKPATAGQAAIPHGSTKAAPHRTKTAKSGRMVTTKTTTGKSITYDCAKPGNATKAACKR